MSKFRPKSFAATVEASPAADGKVVSAFANRTFAFEANVTVVADFGKIA